MHPAYRGCLQPWERGLVLICSLDRDYIVPEYLRFRYTFSVNTFQQAFNRKITDFVIICTSNNIFGVGILFVMTEKSKKFCGKVFALDERYLKIFLMS